LIPCRVLFLAAALFAIIDYPSALWDIEALQWISASRPPATVIFFSRYFFFLGLETLGDLGWTRSKLFDV
jgi:hypothetical protein